MTSALLDVVVRLLLRLRVGGASNIPRAGAGLVVANHVSYLDPVVLLVLLRRCGRRVRVMAVEEAFTRPVSGWFIRAGRHIPVPAGQQRLSAIRLAREALAAGELVLVYPEGTIPGDPQLVEAKGGVGLLAVSSGAPVIPVGSWGLERGGRRRGLRRPAAVVVGRPMELPHLQERGRRRYETVSDLLIARVRRLSREAQDLAPVAGARRRRPSFRGRPAHQVRHQEDSCRPQ